MSPAPNTSRPAQMTTAGTLPHQGSFTFLPFSRSDLKALAAFAVLSLVPIMAISLSGAAPSGAAGSGFAHVIALAIWALCLRQSGLPDIWVAVAVLGLASALASSPFGIWNISGLGEAVFVYVLFSLLSAYDKQPNLQAIAASALLISAGILTKPPVAIACVLISIMFFLFHCRRTASGSLGLALLMFTPAVLCTVSAALLALVTGGVVNASGITPDGSVTELSHVSVSASPSPDVAIMSMSWLIFPACLVALRVCLRRASACDAALGFMLLGTMFFSSFPGIPHQIQPIDSFYLAAGSGAALTVDTVRRRRWGSVANPADARLAA